MEYKIELLGVEYDLFVEHDLATFQDTLFNLFIEENKEINEIASMSNISEGDIVYHLRKMELYEDKHFCPNACGRKARVHWMIEKELLKKGYSPTVRQICSKLGIPSTSTVQKTIEELVKEGVLIKGPGKNRIIKVSKSVKTAMINNQELSMDNIVLALDNMLGKTYLTHEERVCIEQAKQYILRTS